MEVFCDLNPHLVTISGEKPREKGTLGKRRDFQPQARFSQPKRQRLLTPIGGASKNTETSRFHAGISQSRTGISSLTPEFPASSRNFPAKTSRLPAPIGGCLKTPKLPGSMLEFPSPTPGFPVLRQNLQPQAGIFQPKRQGPLPQLGGGKNTETSKFYTGTFQPQAGISSLAPERSSPKPEHSSQNVKDSAPNRGCPKTPGFSAKNTGGFTNRGYYKTSES